MALVIAYMERNTTWILIFAAIAAVLWFKRKNSNSVTAATTMLPATPSNSVNSATSGDTFSGVGTIAAGVTGPSGGRASIHVPTFFAAPIGRPKVSVPISSKLPMSSAIPIPKAVVPKAIIPPVSSQHQPKNPGSPVKQPSPYIYCCVVLGHPVVSKNCCNPGYSCGTRNLVCCTCKIAERSTGGCGPSIRCLEASGLSICSINQMCPSYSTV